MNTIEMTDFKEIDLVEAHSINGGGFAYDVGFFIRAFVIGGGTGPGIAMEYALNYRPA